MQWGLRGLKSRGVYTMEQGIVTPAPHATN
jgi:hypothetical protein